MELSLTSSLVSEQKQTLAVACEGHALCSPTISVLAPSEVLLSFLAQTEYAQWLSLKSQIVSLPTTDGVDCWNRCAGPMARNAPAARPRTSCASPQTSSCSGALTASINSP